MGLSVRRPFRRFAALLALVGTLLYTALVPGHFTSQLAGHFLHAALGDALSVMCRNDAVAAANGETDPLHPGAPDSHCPICKSGAGFQLGILPPALVAFVARPVVREAFRPRDEAVTDRVRVTPRSRGPPLPA